MCSVVAVSGAMLVRTSNCRSWRSQNIGHSYYRKQMFPRGETAIKASDLCYSPSDSLWSAGHGPWFGSSISVLFVSLFSCTTLSTDSLQFPVSCVLVLRSSRSVFRFLFRQSSHRSLGVHLYFKRFNHSFTNFVVRFSFTPKPDCPLTNIPD